MNKLQILVVEDDAPVRNLITTTLKAHEYKHIVAATGDFSVHDAVRTFLQDKGAQPKFSLLHLGRSLTDPLAFLFRHTWTLCPSCTRPI